MAVEKLSISMVEKKKTPGLYSDGGGLYLRVAPGGSKGWIFRFKRDGWQRDMGLGSASTFSLREARELAQQCRKLLYFGEDPIEVRHRHKQQNKLDKAKAVTFAECAKAYIAAHKAGWKNPKHAAQWPSTLAAYVNPFFGDVSVQAVDTALVLKALEPIWLDKPETASRVRGRVEAVLDWATAAGYRQGQNAARWRGHLDQLLPNRTKVARVARAAKGRGEHHAAMPFAEVPAFMVALRGRDAVAAQALEFTILTGKRTEEVIGARPSEFDLTTKTWTIPAGRMKGEREHRVPLSDAAVEVIKPLLDVAPTDGFVFPGGKLGRPLSNMAMLVLLQKRMQHAQVTVHGFRSSFRDWAAERTSFPAEVAEMALAHVVSDKVEAAYRRGDLFEKRRQLSEAWARFCSTPSAEHGPSKIASIRE
jgi:integrase